jgi:hypothetical protein
MYFSRVLLALLLATGAASALNAATPVRSANVWDDIVQLDRDVDRADRADKISEREAAGLHAQVGDLKAAYRRLNANGLTPAEARTLNDRIRRLRTRLGNERHDADHHRG